MEENLSRGDYVEFRYLNGKNVKNVRGWVDKISRDSIHVGNEQVLINEGVNLDHTKRYKTNKIERLSKI